jgi:lysylphosphatidylglycerol synthetase-like protein (DUF2156 family)
MKIPKELYNGIIIWIGIIYFLTMKALNLGFILSQSAEYSLYLLWRKQNVKSNYKEGKLIFQLMQPLLVTALIGVFISIIGLVFYSYLQGGDKYIESLGLLLFGGDPTVVTYGISLL